ncbi:MAG: zf-HC2 domain-containing protein [Anaerolineales bacterium]|nr:zf-HC2 domain-containing protein [Anaerolineales bacterium]
MSKAIHTWLQAYYDDELPARRRAQFQAHLAECLQCQRDLRQLEIVSQQLRQDPPMSLPATEVFVSQINLRLPRRPEQPRGWRALERGWQLAPLGLLGSWATLQAVLLVSSLLLWSLPWLPGGDLLAAGSGGFGLPADWLILPLPGSQPLQFTQSLLSTLPGFGSLSWLLLLDLAASMITGLLYLSWLASWWIRTEQQFNPSAHA